MLTLTINLYKRETIPTAKTAAIIKYLQVSKNKVVKELYPENYKT